MTIPLVDLKAQYETIKDEIKASITRVMENSQFVLGEETQAFEEEFAEYCGAKYCVGVGSGTDALFLALKACGIGRGDAVITVPNTFIATAEAVSHSGATPVFVDANPDTYNMDPEKVQELLEKDCFINDKTGQLVHRKTENHVKAIIPVHLYGLPADMDSINTMAQRYGLKVIEDACQAHGAEYKGKKAGSLGDVACFSFYPSKNLGAFGDGGIVVTDNEAIWQKAKMLRDHGQSSKSRHELVGYNSRLDSVQAAALRVKLTKLNEWNNLRRAHAELYNKLLGESEVITPKHSQRTACDDVIHVYHLYVVRIKDREVVTKRLTDTGISFGIHYPTPIHLQSCYQYLRYRPGDFPVVERYSKTILSLPMFPELNDSQILLVAEAILG